MFYVALWYVQVLVFVLIIFSLQSKPGSMTILSSQILNVVLAGHINQFVVLLWTEE